MRITLLGPVAVIDGTTSVAVGGPRVKALLALLALEVGRTVPATRLIDAIWADAPPTDPGNALQTLVKRLRAVLGRSAVQARSGGYRLAVDPAAVDAHRFVSLVSEARRLAASDQAERAIPVLVDAVALRQGPALSDLADHPALAAAAVPLDEAGLGAVELLADCYRLLGRAPDSIPLLTAETAAHPLRESLVVRLMTALAAGGRRSEALTLYQRTRDRLADELGVSPSAALGEYFLDLLREGDEAAQTLFPAVPTNLPRPLTTFVGREAEVGAVTSRLAASALVTLTGPGGTGKTRLATEAAARMSAGFPDGVWLVELAGITDAAVVRGAVLLAVGAGDADAADADSAVAAALRDRRALLVLDNCEHLLSGVAVLVQTILDRCPGLRVLATSREPLGLGAENVLPVQPLEAAPIGADPEQAARFPAVRLFLDRAAQARPGFTLDPDNCAAVCAICRDLDGMPLALELAATRMRSMTPADLRDRLADRFAVLTGRRGVAPRHRSLRAVVAWSWDLLDDTERELARGVSVFAGGTTAEAVASVFGADAVLTLASLVDKSFVQWDGSRYRMLETIRAFAHEDLATTGGLHEASRRHAEYFTELAETAEPALRTADQQRWLTRLGAEHDNFLAALDWSVRASRTAIALRLFGSFSWYLLARDLRIALLSWRPRVLSLLPDGPPTGLTSAYLACAYAGDPQELLSPSHWNRMLREGFPARYRQASTEPHPPHPLFTLVMAHHDTDGTGPEALDALAGSTDQSLPG